MFDRAVELPTATLRSGAPQARHRALSGYLRRWIASHWAWLRPRSIPMLVAVAGMFAVLGATRYLSDLAHGDPRPTLVYAPARAHAEADQPRCAGTPSPATSGDAARDAVHLAPVRPGSPDVTVQLGR